MYKYQQPSRETGYKEQVEEGFYKALPTEGMEQFKAADYYSNLTINSAFYKEGTKILDNGESYPWAFITCEVIDCNQNKKGWMSLSLTTQNGQERMNELVYLLNMKGQDGNPGINIREVAGTGQNFLVEQNLPGKKISAVFDNFRENRQKAGQIDFKILGFFKDGRSAREIMANKPIEECRDLEDCIRSIKQPRGADIVLKESFNPVGVNIQRSAPVQNQSRPPMQNQAIQTPAQQQRIPTPQRPNAPVIPQRQAAPVRQSAYQQNNTAYLDPNYQNPNEPEDIPF